MFGNISIHFITFSYFSSQYSFIMLVNILLFQHYSRQICNLLFSKLCQHNRLGPSHQEGRQETKVKVQIHGLDATDLMRVTAHSWTAPSDMFTQGAMANTQL